MATKTCKKPGQKASKAHIVTEKEAAAIDFEPWSVDMKFLPTNDEFIKDGLSHLITCRLALGVMYMTKAKIMDMFEEDGDATAELIDYFKRSLSFFSHFSELLELAGWRLVCAGSSVLQEESRRKQQPLNGNV